MEVQAMSVYRTHLQGLVAAGLFVFALPLAAWAQSFSVVDIGASDPYSLGLTVTGMNDAGEVVGNINTPAGTSAFSYANGDMTILNFTGAAAVNGTGQIAGDNGPDAILYSGGKITDLGEGSAVGINSSGEVVGNDTYNPFTWSNGVRKELGSFIVGDGATFATAINDSGEIVGYDEAPGWHDAVAYGLGYYIGDLNAAPGDGPPSLTTATGINNAGQIIGLWLDAHNQSWGGIIAGGGDVYAAGFVPDDINSGGEVVGYSTNSGDAVIGGVGQMLDLNSLIAQGTGDRLENAVGVNDGGWIICQGVNSQGQQDGFLLIPAPEPTTPAILTIGVGLALARRCNPTMPIASR
jgi:hypothetical protein